MSSGSSLSPSGWIQTANRFTSTATWAAYSSALAALTLNQMNGSPSTSPTQPPDSPPYDYFSYGVKRTHSGGVKRSKSFTIDAILGLRRDVAPPTDEITSPSSSTTCFNFTEKKSEAETPAAPVASPGGASSPRAKRVRTIFSAEQLERLEAEFARQQYMVGPERLILAASLRLSESQVKVWFQNRRIKWRKQHLEAQQMRLVSWRQQEHGVAMATGEDDQSESFSD